MAAKKNVPVLRNRYPFTDMEIGDMFTVKIPADNPMAGTRALTAAYAVARRHGKQFTGQSQVVRGKPRMNIWRVA